MKQNRILSFMALISLMALTVWAGVPQLINFQGQLKNSTGSPLANDTLAVEFKIYDDASAGNVKWSEVDTVITDANGLFTILLGNKTPVPDSVFNDSLRWLGIKVGSDPEISLRSRLSSVGYSYVSSQWTSAGQNLFRLSGNVGIGTSNPSIPLEVISGGLAIHGHSTNAIAVNGTSDVGVGVEGDANGLSSFPIYGCVGNSNNNSNGNAYGGSFTGYSSSGIGYGVYGVGGSYGVYGTSTAGYGVYGDGGSYGVYGNSSVFFGVFGNSASGEGVRGVSTSGPGVHGVSTNSYGVYAASTNGYGVYATGGPNGVVASANSGAAVSATSSSGDGVYASGTANGVNATGGVRGVYATGGTYGVVGGASANGGAGVYGSNSGNPATWAGYFLGDTYCTGNWTVAGFKSATVKLDNGEYRLLYAQESPENWFEDFGTAQMMDGKAAVNIDPLFAQTVNTAVEYHVFLTPKGDCRGVYVTNETPTSFEIKELQNGKSDLAVSYRIVAKRKGYENVRLAKLVGKTPEVAEAEDAKLRAQMAEENAKHSREQAKMEAERKNLEEQRIKMEPELKGTDNK